MIQCAQSPTSQVGRGSADREEYVALEIQGLWIFSELIADSAVLCIAGMSSESHTIIPGLVASSRPASSRSRRPVLLMTAVLTVLAVGYCVVSQNATVSLASFTRLHWSYDEVDAWEGADCQQGSTQVRQAACGILRCTSFGMCNVPQFNCAAAASVRVMQHSNFIADNFLLPSPPDAGRHQTRRSSTRRTITSGMGHYRRTCHPQHLLQRPRCAGSRLRHSRHCQIRR